MPYTNTPHVEQSETNHIRMYVVDTRFSYISRRTDACRHSPELFQFVLLLSMFMFNLGGLKKLALLWEIALLWVVTEPRILTLQYQRVWAVRVALDDPGTLDACYPAFYLTFAGIASLQDSLQFPETKHRSMTALGAKCLTFHSESLLVRRESHFLSLLLARPRRRRQMWKRNERNIIESTKGPCLLWCCEEHVRCKDLSHVKAIRTIEARNWKLLVFPDGLYSRKDINIGHPAAKS